MPPHGSDTTSSVMIQSHESRADENAFSLLEIETTESSSPPRNNRRSLVLPTVVLHGKIRNTQTTTQKEEKQASPPQRRTVSFHSLHIREYDQILGDHPCCTEGPPLSLGWNYRHTPISVLLDEYENSRPPRRTRHKLRMGGDTRRNILITAAICDKAPNVTQEDVKRDVRRAERKLNRQRVNRRANDLFFHPIQSQQQQQQLTDPTTDSE